MRSSSGGRLLPRSAAGRRYLADEHASRHGESGAGREVGRDHDPQAGLREGQLVRVEDEELVHHHDWRSLLAVDLACGKVLRCDGVLFKAVEAAGRF